MGTQQCICYRLWWIYPCQSWELERVGGRLLGSWQWGVIYNQGSDMSWRLYIPAGGSRCLRSPNRRALTRSRVFGGHAVGLAQCNLVWGEGSRRKGWVRLVVTIATRCWQLGHHKENIDQFVIALPLIRNVAPQEYQVEKGWEKTQVLCVALSLVKWNNPFHFHFLLKILN